jgi:hypothetical protein
MASARLYQSVSIRLDCNEIRIQWHFSVQADRWFVRIIPAAFLGPKSLPSSAESA